MSIVFCIEMVVVGCLVGTVNAALGLGGGFVMVPALREFVPGIDPHTAKGTSLFIIVFVAALNAWRQNRGSGGVPWRVAGVLASGSILGGYAGAWFTGLLSGNAVTWIFIALLGVMCVRLLLTEPKPPTETGKRPKDVLAFAIGLATGLASGMAGIGGGIVLVPLVLLVGLSTNERVTGLSNLVMVATCSAGAFVHLRADQTLAMPGTVGQVSLAVAPLIFLGAQAGSPLGRWMNEHLTFSQRKFALVTLAVVIAARMVYRALQ